MKLFKTMKIDKNRSCKWLYHFVELHQKFIQISMRAGEYLGFIATSVPFTILERWLNNYP